MYQSMYLITGQPGNNEQEFLENLKFSLDRGIKLVQIRAKELDFYNYKKLASQAISLCHQYGAKALLSVHIDLVEELKADGIHLPSSYLMNLNQRPIASTKILSVACHNEEQVLHASKIGAEMMVICPIFATPSSPKGNPLGWETFSSLARLSNIPSYALGGVKPEDLTIAQSYGATGIAAIRSLWGRQE